MITHEMFYKKFGVRRVGDLNKVNNLSDLTEVPVNTVIHMLDNIEHISEEEFNVIPDLNNPFLKLDPEKKLIYPVTQTLTKKTVHRPATKGMMYRGATVPRKTAKFFKDNVKNIRPFKGDVSELTGTTVRSAFLSYNSLFSFKMTGLGKSLRMFDTVLASMFNHANMISVPQYVTVPLDNIRFEQSDFNRVLKGPIDRKTVKMGESPRYLMMMHILSYMSDKSESSWFNDIDVLDKLNFVFINDDKFSIINLATAKELLKGANVVTKITDHFNKLYTSQLGELEETERVDAKLITSPKKVTDSNYAVFKGNKPANDVAKSITESEMMKDTMAREIIDAQTELTPKQKERVKEISKKFKSIEVEGVPLENFIETPVDTKTNDTKLEFLSGHIEDKSMLSSKLMSFSNDYMQTTFKQDMIRNLTSFRSAGMFLVDYQEKDVSDSRNQLIEYTAKYEDVHGKKHTIKFTIPKVDKDGKCLINGSVKRMKIQRINMPIVKDSPMRVLLSSAFNKTIVQRRVTTTNSFYPYFKKIISKHSDQWTIGHGTNTYPDLSVAYEYSAMGKHMNQISFKAIDKRPGFQWTFDYENRYKGIRSPQKIIDLKIAREKKYGVYMGSGGEGLEYYIASNGTLTVTQGDDVQETTSIIDYVSKHLDIEPKSLREWCDLKILDKQIPVVIVLAYKYGLQGLLKYLNIPYQIYEPREKYESNVSDITVVFKDKKLVIPGIKKFNQFIFSGLNNFRLSNIYLEDMEIKDAYFDILQTKGLSTNYLKGIMSFYEFFMDPVTESVLLEMGEPTNFRDLLIRSVSMLTTEDVKQSSSCGNYRFRSYEQFNNTVYNKLARALATYKNGSIGAKKKFSISSFEIMGAIMKDPLMEQVDIVNPINELKTLCAFSHIGEGGRSRRAFVVNDRQYPEDGVGIISEATVDSGNVAVDAMLSMDPHIVNTRGMTTTKKLDDVEPTELLSVTSLLIPGADTDDGKRANFINIQMGQYVPTAKGEPSRIRTGFERVLAHRVGLPFSFPADKDGKVLEIDEKLKTITIQYKGEGPLTVKYGEEYSRNAGGGFYVTQNIELNKLKVGKSFKRGDILLYNSDYFTADPYSTQVDANLGHHANIAMMEMDRTMEDGCIIARNTSYGLASSPTQTRIITLSKDTNIHQLAMPGTKVKSTDVLMTFDESGLNVEEDDEDLISALNKLNRATPKAKYDGEVVKIEAFHKMPVSEMSNSMAKVVRAISKDDRARANKASGSANADQYVAPGPIMDDKIEGIDMTEETVILKVYIKQNLSMEAGDKVVFGSSLKSVCGEIVDSMSTEDDLIVDGAMAVTSEQNRMIHSVKRIGIMNRIMERADEMFVDEYFK